MTGPAPRSTPQLGVSLGIAWLRAGRGRLFLLAPLIGARSGLGAVAASAPAAMPS